jgi:hypothetical protein
MNQQLWENIVDFDLDTPMGEYGFSTRLENENFWTVNFAREAILEYKKFMYLAVVSDLMVAPSEIVDVVWHQHLIFTQSYDDFCTLLGKKIAHIPSIHNSKDVESFKLASERTNKLYTENFGIPPAAIWEYKDMTGQLEMQPAPFNLLSVLTIGGLILLPLAILVGYLFLRPVYITIDNPDFIIGYVLIVVVSVICLTYYNRVKLNEIVHGWPQNAFIFNLTALELIYIGKSNLPDVIHGLVNQLILNKKITILSDRKLMVNNVELAESPMELCVLQTISAARLISYPELLKRLVLKPVFNKTARAMDDFKAYYKRSAPFVKLFTINFTVLAFIFLIGAVRLVAGWMRDKPIIIIGVVMMVCIFLTVTYLHYLTVAIGTAVLPKFYLKNILPEKTIKNDWEWDYFLTGNDVFVASFIPIVAAFTGSGGGGGDSGSSCGSGGGGGCGSGGSCGGCGH